MRVFIPNIRTVKELTRYISPLEIERARFKKFNSPIINDGNIVCDEFFRVEELFDRKRDILTPLTTYSIDDVPVIDHTSLLARDIQILEGTNSSYIETDLPYYVDIIGENKRIYLEGYGVKGSKSKIDTKSYKNCSVDELANIRYYAYKYSPSNPFSAELEGVKLLKDGYPLEGVINIIKESSTEGINGSLLCPRPLMRFIAKFPKLKRYMFTYDNKKREILDVAAAGMFHELVETCKGDEKLAYQILWDCRVEKSNGSFRTYPDLLLLGQNLYKNGDYWSPEKAKIVHYVSLRDPKSYKYSSAKVNNMQKRHTINYIVTYLESKNKSKIKNKL